MAILKYGGTQSCAPGKASQRIFETAEDFGILKTAGMRIDRPSVAVHRLEQMRKASVPYQAVLVADRINSLNFITSLFIHAGWIHLIFTLWFFHLAGTALEKHWGTGRFLGIFLVCGILGGRAYLIARLPPRPDHRKSGIRQGLRKTGSLKPDLEKHIRGINRSGLNQYAAT